MSGDTGRYNLDFAIGFVGELARAGLKHVVISPGSRSTPLALAFAKHPGIRPWVLIDERSAAFFALGMARHIHEPVALLCTSGTAAANYLPAVVEASLSRIPLLVLTADRPPELRDWGAAQTIDQIEIYGSHAKWAADMPVPDGSPTLLRHARAMGRRAYQTAAAIPAGPVHLNQPFREPLLPDPLPEVSAWQCGSNPMDEVGTTTVEYPGVNPVTKGTDHAFERLTTTIAATPHGIIVCGPAETNGYAATVAALATATGYPILADPLSTLRYGQHDLSHVISTYDTFVREPGVASQLAPDLVIRFGAMPTSKPLQQFLTAHPGQTHVLVDPGSPRDPFHLATVHLQADPASVATYLTTALTPSAATPDPAWLARWLSVDRATRGALHRFAAEDDALFEGRIAAEVVRSLPDGATLVVGNSLPVRDIDTYAAATNREIRVVGTRGASGIDGVVSTALGAAAVSDGPVILLIGDLSLYHDMNGLLASKHHHLDLTIVVVNNGGGGIFSFLPQHRLVDPDTYELLFGTPHEIEFARVAALYDACFRCPSSMPELAAALGGAIGAQGLSLIEAKTDRQENLSRHRRITASTLQTLARMALASPADA